MKISVYYIDAFTQKLFSGNPAAVCPLDCWLDDQMLQKIALENNLETTAFFVKHNEEYEIRWFTPQKEVSFCGNSTIASAFVIFNFIEDQTFKVSFIYQGDTVTVTREENGLLSLSFPSFMPKLGHYSPLFDLAFGIDPLKVLQSGENYILIYENENVVQNLKINREVLPRLNMQGIYIAAKGDECDFVFRFFAPNSNIKGDSYSKSVCAEIAPFWSEVLNKKTLVSHQLSQRGSEIICEVENNRVNIKGKSVLCMQGIMYIELESEREEVAVA